MSHELDKLDKHLELPIGTSRSVVCSHKDPTLLNEKLAKYGIELTHIGMLPKEQQPKWQALMKELGVAERYWKNKDRLTPSDFVND